MAAKPPAAFSSSVPPKVAGVTPTTPAKAPVTSSSSSNKGTPIGNGDFLLGVMPFNPRHEVKIIQRTDGSQFVPCLAQCKCGTEGRGMTEELVRNFALQHFDRRKSEVLS